MYINSEGLKIYTCEDFGGINNVLQYCVPSGIGDVSWVYSKLHSAAKNLGRKLLLYSPSEEPKRSADLISLLPDTYFGGYLDDRTSWQVISQSLPADWPDHLGYGFVYNTYIQNVAANLHLESGKKLHNWWPKFSIDYHYDLNIENEQIKEANHILKTLPTNKSIIGVYVSNRDKDTILSGGWNLWTSSQWAQFLLNIQSILKKYSYECHFVIIGAEYDRDKSEAVASLLPKENVTTLINRDLGTILYIMKHFNYFFSYPSGMGILANVLRVPCVMLLPWLLKNLSDAYADPEDLTLQIYKAWSNPTTVEVETWFEYIGFPQVIARYGNFNSKIL